VKITLDDYIDLPGYWQSSIRSTKNLYVEKLPGESIAAYFKRFKSKTGVSPSHENFVRCYQPFAVTHSGLKWTEIHEWFTESGHADNYTWYGSFFYFETEELAVTFRLLCSE